MTSYDWHAPTLARRLDKGIRYKAQQVLANSVLRLTRTHHSELDEARIVRRVEVFLYRALHIAMHTACQTIEDFIRAAQLQQSNSCVLKAIALRLPRLSLTASSMRSNR